MATVEVQVSAGADDGRTWDAGAGSPGFTNSDQISKAGYDTTYGNLHSFFRFGNVTISGRITVAYLKVFGAEFFPAEGTPELKLYGVKEDNPAAPTSYAEFMADPLTTASVDWNGAWTSDAWNESPSLVNIFQELISNFDIQNEAVMLQLRNDHGVTGSDEVNYCEAYDSGVQEEAPTLHIEYTSQRFFIVTTGGVSW